MIKGLHIELTNMCTLKCPGCSRTQVIDRFPNYWKNHNLDLELLKNFLDIDLTGIGINLCGNHGDPIYYPNLLDAISWFKAKGAHVYLHTNGSYKSKDWWQSLSHVMTSEDTIIFSIDGTPDNFTQYRINANWPSILEGITVMTSSLAYCVWKYIVFNYNEQTIKQAESLCYELGFDEFRISRSDRFVDRYQPSDSWVSVRFQKQGSTTIDAKCADQKHHYVSADGYYLPCCYLASKNILFKTDWGKDRSRFSISNHTLSELLRSKFVNEFNQNLLERPNDYCLTQCPG